MISVLVVINKPLHGWVTSYYFQQIEREKGKYVSLQTDLKTAETKINNLKQSNTKLGLFKQEKNLIIGVTLFAF